MHEKIKLEQSDEKLRPGGSCCTEGGWKWLWLISMSTFSTTSLLYVINLNFITLERALCCFGGGWCNVGRVEQGLVFSQIKPSCGFAWRLQSPVEPGRYQPLVSIFKHCNSHWMKVGLGWGLGLRLMLGALACLASVCGRFSTGGLHAFSRSHSSTYLRWGA